jgi:hypothetical protein
MTTTQTIAGTLISLCREGKFIEAQKECYDDQIISIEPDGSKTTGLVNMNAKEQKFLDSIEKIHHIDFSEPVIAGNYFSAKLVMEIEFKNGMRRRMEELCIYKVVNNKIVFEQFFRD